MAHRVGEVVPQRGRLTDELVPDGRDPQALSRWWCEVLEWDELGREDGDHAGLERLLGLGARPVEVGQTGAESWHVLADPEGNEF